MPLVPRIVAILCLSAFLVGCGDSAPQAPATDPESVKKLEELQKKGRSGEK
jgi:hypothetical protein